MWKDFFYFSRTEKRGVIVFVSLICITVIVGLVLHDYNKQHLTGEAEFPAEEYQRFITSLKEYNPTVRSGQRKEHGNSLAQPHVVLSRFDPNTADSAMLCHLGMPGWMARNILRYRAKGGVFREPEDFQKVYGLQKEQFDELLPYIFIDERFRRQPLPENPIASAPMADHQEHIAADTLKRAFKYPAGTVIDLNTADTAELKKIPGIGSVTARRIVTYRKQLGGFYQISQLHELGEEIGKLTEWFKVEEGETQRINLNTASVERLKAHPYFNFYQAKAVVEHRKKKGALKRLSQLSFFDEFTAEDLERIKYYVKLE